MKICLVSTEVAGYRGGGIGTYVVEAGKALRAAGHEVWLVTRAPDEPAPREELRAHRAFSQVRFVEETSDDFERFHYALAYEATWFSALAHETIRAAGVAFDYVEFPDYLAEGWVAVLEQKLFDTYGDAVLGVTLHSPTHECFQYNEQLHLIDPHLRELCALEEDAIRNAPLLWCPSTRLLEIVRERLGLGDRGHVVRYPMELPPDAPPPPAPRSSLAELRFLYFGRIEPRKGVHHLIEAFRRLPELRIELIGADRPASPFNSSEVAWLSRRLPPNVSSRLPLPRDELLARIGAADVCVLPSTWDNWPNTCIEAMTAARVVIGGRHGGMAEMIEHGTSGFLVDGSDPADIARVIRDELGGALDRLDAIGAAAARRIRELSEPTRYAAAIERLVAEHRGQGRPPARPARAPKVSIIVPFYNEDRAILGEAIDSAIAQTWRETEILIVEDGSPRADAPAILADMQRRDPRVRVLHKENGGLASARNFAVEQAAAGDYFLFLDADNVLRPEYAATGVAVLERHPDLAAIAPQLQIFDAKTRAPKVIINPLPFDRSLAMFRNEIGDAGAMFRANVFRDHGLRYDSLVDVYSDWALWLDCARAGLRVQAVPRVLYDYRLRADSMMGEQAWDRHLALLGLLIERHWLPGDEAEHKQQLTTLVHGWGVGAILSALGSRPEYWRHPVAAARRMHASATRYRVADALAKVFGKVPGVARLSAATFERVFRWHGKWKDRRRGMRPL